jgi:hypothetical protein
MERRYRRGRLGSLIGPLTWADQGIFLRNGHDGCMTSFPESMNISTNGDLVFINVFIRDLYLRRKFFKLLFNPD